MRLRKCGIVVLWIHNRIPLVQRKLTKALMNVDLLERSKFEVRPAAIPLIFCMFSVGQLACPFLRFDKVLSSLQLFLCAPGMTATARTQARADIAHAGWALKKPASFAVRVEAGRRAG